MFELSPILLAFKQYGIAGAFIAILVVFGSKWFFGKLQERKERDMARWSSINIMQQNLLNQMSAASATSAALIREERTANQANTVRWFDILDRNTRSVEKLVEKMDEHTREQSGIRDQLSRIEGKHIDRQ